MSDDEEDGPNKNARNSDPWTSHAAADPSEEKRRDMARVWAVFVREQRPLADFELEELLGGPRNGKWRKRRSDLTRDKFLTAVGQKLCLATGKMQNTWAITPKEEPPPEIKWRNDLFEG